jgi:hypothetical protein
MSTEQHQAEWEALAQAEDRKAEYATERGLYAGVYKAKADTYRKCVESMRLSDLHGEPYCSCHFIPIRLATRLRSGVR